MKNRFRWIVGVAFIAGATTAPASPQVLSSTSRPAAVPIKIQLVVTKGEGDKKVSSPFSLFASSSGENLSLRIGVEVPVGAAIEQLGTQIDFSVTATPEGRFQLVLNFKGRLPSTEGKPRDFTASNTFILRDGESTKYTGADDSGGSFTVDVTLNVVK